MKYSVIKRVVGLPDIEFCIEAINRKEAVERAKLEKGETISITRWWDNATE